MEDITAELAAAFGIDALVQRGGEELYEHYLDEKVIPFTLEQLLGMLATGLELHFNRRDVGEAQTWPADPDPVPNPVDSWARSHVAVRKVIREPVEISPSPISIEDKSIQSITSRRTLTRKSTHPPPVQIQSLERPQLYIIESAIEQPEPELDALRANKEKQIQLRKAEIDRERQWKIQREEEARRLDRMASELRNSNFTYDYEGRIVLMKTRPLPSPSIVQYSLTGLIPQNQPTKPGKNVNPPKRPVQVTKKTPVTEVQFVKSINATPSIMELLKVTSGVSAYESNRAKRGPDVKGKTMTREEYRVLTKEADEQYEASLTGENRVKSDKRRKGGSRKSIEEIPDSDRDEELHVSASVPNLPPRQDLTAVDQFNLQILKSHDWGMNTTPQVNGPVKIPLPVKPSIQLLRATLGSKVKHPRDRPFIDKKPIREYQPQPPLGKTMGHGLLEG